MVPHFGSSLDVDVDVYVQSWHGMVCAHFFQTVLKADRSFELARTID
jgi:hypothetical protein